MSQSEIKRFTVRLKSDKALRTEAEKAQAGKSRETRLARAVAFAASKGYAFTINEAKQHAQARAKVNGKEFTDAELDDVSEGSCLAFFFSGGSCLTCYDAPENSCLVARTEAELDADADRTSGHGPK
jgi:hypothetical protein